MHAQDRRYGPFLPQADPDHSKSSNQRGRQVYRQLPRRHDRDMSPERPIDERQSERAIAGGEAYWALERYLRLLIPAAARSEEPIAPPPRVSAPFQAGPRMRQAPTVCAVPPCLAAPATAAHSPAIRDGPRRRARTACARADPGGAWQITRTGPAGRSG